MIDGSVMNSSELKRNYRGETSSGGESIDFQDFLATPPPPPLGEIPLRSGVPSVVGESVLGLGDQCDKVLETVRRKIENLKIKASGDEGLDDGDVSLLGLVMDNQGLSHGWVKSIAGGFTFSSPS